MRHGILLLTLLGMPLAAVFGTRLPGFLQDWYGQPTRDWSENWVADTATEIDGQAPDSQASGEAQIYVPPAQALYGSDQVPAGDPGLAGNSPGSAGAADAGQMRVVPRRGAAPAGDQRQGNAGGSSPIAYGSQPNTGNSVHPADDALPAEGVSSELADSDAPMGNSAGEAGGPNVAEDEFSQAERRLRELGATYYLLETWGESPVRYRFHCRMAMGRSSGLTRHFEATGDAPLEAMRRVLSDVAAWRAGKVR